MNRKQWVVCHNYLVLRYRLFDDALWVDAGPIGLNISRGRIGQASFYARDEHGERDIPPILSRVVRELANEARE